MKKFFTDLFSPTIYVEEPCTALDKYQVHMRKGQHHKELRQFEAALVDFKHALHYKREDSSALFEISELNLLIGQSAETNKDSEAALNEQPPTIEPQPIPQKSDRAPFFSASIEYRIKTNGYTFDMQPEHLKVTFSLKEIGYLLSLIGECPTQHFPLDISRYPESEIPYLWTAAMLFGMNSSYQFDHNAIKTYDYHRTGRRFDPSLERGLFFKGVFSKKSLYSQRCFSARKFSASDYVIPTAEDAEKTKSDLIAKMLQKFDSVHDAGNQNGKLELISFLNMDFISRFDGNNSMNTQNWYCFAHFNIVSILSQHYNEIKPSKRNVLQINLREILLSWPSIRINNMSNLACYFMLAARDIGKHPIWGFADDAIHISDQPIVLGLRNPRVLGHASKVGIPGTAVTLDRDFLKKISEYPSARVTLNFVHLDPDTRNLLWSIIEEIQQPKIEAEKNRQLDAVNKRKQAELNEQESKAKQKIKFATEDLFYYCKLTNERAPLSRVAECIANGAIINERDNDGNTPLLLALQTGQEEVARFLLSKGADPIYRNRHGLTAMDCVSTFSPLYELMNEKIRPKQQESQSKNPLTGQTSIDQLNQKLHEEMMNITPSAINIKSLLAKGAQIDSQNEEGYTILMIAVDKQDHRLADYLLRQGANPLLKSKSGDTARDFISANSPLYELLCGYEFLMLCSLNSIDQIKRSLSQNSQIINFQNHLGYSALLNAVKCSNFELVDFLLRAGADMKLTLHDGTGIMDIVTDIRISSLLEKIAAADNMATSHPDYADLNQGSDPDNEPISDSPNNSM